MNRPAMLLLAACFVAFAGCDSVDSDLPSPSVSGTMDLGDHPETALGTVSSIVTLNGYSVEFLSAAPAPGIEGATVFTYEVTRLGSSGPSFNYFFLENACGADPVAWTPTESVTQGTNADTGIYGVQWNPSLNEGSRRYSYTFVGAQLGVVRTVIRKGSVTETASLPGPCGGLATLSGSVFVNTDADPARSGTELGIGNVQVDVYDGDALVASRTTSANANGSFSFTLPRAEYTTTGTYSVRIPTSSAGTFNAGLYSSYNYTGAPAPAVRSVELSGDVSGIDFGFNPDKQKILDNISPGGVYQTQAQGVNFWQGVIRKVNQNRPCNDNDADPTTICRAELEGYLDAIFYSNGEAEGAYYLLSEPFTLPAGANMFTEAADLLSRPTQTDAAKVSRNLFAMQLNLMKGWGTPSRSFDDALMAYLEEWVRVESGTAARSGGDEGTMFQALRPVGSAAKAGGGGGGTIEESITRTYLLGGGGGGTID